MPSGETAIVYLESDTLDADIGAARSRQPRLPARPRDESWLWREARLKDPDGNEICLYHAGVNRLDPPWREARSGPLRGLTDGGAAALKRTDLRMEAHRPDRRPLVNPPPPITRSSTARGSAPAGRRPFGPHRHVFARFRHRRAPSGARRLGRGQRHGGGGRPRAGTGRAELGHLLQHDEHRLRDLAAARRTPLLHIADATAAPILAAGLRRVGLAMGTGFTMEMGFLKGPAWRRPGRKSWCRRRTTAPLIHRVIYDELIKGIISPASREAYLGAIGRPGRPGAEGVILGCTEIGCWWTSR